MKRSKSNPAPEYDVLIPLVNLLLFNKHDSLDFDSDQEKLSDNFIEAVKTINPTEIEDNFFTNRVYFYLKELSPKEREHLFKIIFNNDAYISTLTITNLFLNDITPDEKNTFSIQNKIMIDLLNFREEAKLSKSILLYFTIYFLSIFEYKFSDSKTITKFEYDDLIHNLTNLKENHL